MARIDIQSLKDKEVELIYIAANLKEAKEVEKILMSSTIDYALSIESFDKVMGNVVSVEYKGLFFYVLQGQGKYCKGLLKKAGFIKEWND